MIVLADRGDEQKVIEEEKQNWLIEVLLAINVPPEAFELEIEELKSYLITNGIEIWSNFDGTMDIYRNDDIIAQWKIPKLILIKETLRKWYYEIHIDAWARPLQNKL